MQPCRSRALVALIACAGSLASAIPVRAALDTPASWVSPGTSTPEAEPTSSLAAPWNLWESHIDGTQLQQMLGDTENRVPKEFAIPAGMDEQVRFWLRIYTVYSSRQAVIFDEAHPEIVYEVVDFRNLARTSRNRAAFEIVSRQMLKERVDAYRAGFAQLKRRKVARLSAEASTIRRLSGGLRHAHRLDELQKHLRVQWGQRDQVIQGLRASSGYRSRMDHVFEQMKLPKELTLLSLVESSFNSKALSHAGAAGVWQFMPDSGAEFLMIHPSGSIDERVSPIKSTVAAARLLQRNRKMLGTWPAAISAYNNGHGKWLPVSRAEREQPGRILTQCPKDKHVATRLGFASRNYYAEFLALLRADRYRDVAFGGTNADSERPVRFVRVMEPVALSRLADEHRVPASELLGLNPDVLSTRSPLPPGFLVAVPALRDDFSSIIAATEARERAFRNSRTLARKAQLQAQASSPIGRRPRG